MSCIAWGGGLDVFCVFILGLLDEFAGVERERISSGILTLNNSKSLLCVGFYFSLPNLLLDSQGNFFYIKNKGETK